MPNTGCLDCRQKIKPRSFCHFFYLSYYPLIITPWGALPYEGACYLGLFQSTPCAPLQVKVLASTEHNKLAVPNGLLTFCTTWCTIFTRLWHLICANNFCYLIICLAFLPYCVTDKTFVCEPLNKQTKRLQYL